MDEYQKCFDNPIYYAENYAKFMTDYGLSTVKLRDYQEDIIDKVTEEEYDPENDLIYPTNRNVVICASRQIGKCYCPNTYVLTKDGKNSSKTKIYDLYYNSLTKKTFLKKIKRILYKIYSIL